jgi:hypothetical protein
VNTLRLSLASLVVGFLSLGQAHAQTPPTPAEVAAYRDCTRPPRRAASTPPAAGAAGGDLNGRDGNGRTPLHVPRSKVTAPPRRR